MPSNRTGLKALKNLVSEAELVLSTSPALPENRFAYYNLCRIHRSLRVTPAMEAGIADHVWEIDELLALPICFSGHADFAKCSTNANIKHLLQNQLVGYILRGEY